MVICTILLKYFDKSLSKYSSYGHLSKLRPSCVGYDHHPKYYSWHNDSHTFKVTTIMLEFLNDYLTKIWMILCIKFGFNIKTLSISVLIYETSYLAQMNLLLHENRKRKTSLLSCLPYSDGRNHPLTTSA